MKEKVINPSQRRYVLLDREGTVQAAWDGIGGRDAVVALNPDCANGEAVYIRVGGQPFEDTSIVPHRS